MLRKLVGADLCDWVVALPYHAHEFFLNVVTHILALLFLVRPELRPNLDSEAALLTLLTLVEHAHPAKLIKFLELASHSLEDQFLPQLLNHGYRRLKVYSEFATLLIDRIFPLGLDTVLKQRQAVYTLVIVIDHMNVDRLRRLVVEKVVDIPMLQINPGLRKGDNVVEPSHLTHRIIVVLGLVMFPETPLGWKLKLRVKYFGKFLSLRGCLNRLSTLFLFSHFLLY